MVGLLFETEKKKIRSAMKKLTVDGSTDMVEAVQYLCHDVMLLPPNDPPLMGINAVKAKLMEDSRERIHAIGGKQLNVEYPRRLT